MKKILSGLFIITLFALSVHAQDKSFIGVTGGLSVPGGNYSKGDYSNDKSGFAKTGFNIGITGAWYFKKSHWGIGGILSYTHYGFKNAQSIADGYKEAFDVDSTTAYIKGSNQTVNILIGPYYNIAFGKFNLDLRVLGGVVNATLPGNEIYLEEGIDNHLTQKKATATAFGWQGGASLRYAITSHIGVLAGLDYFYSKPDFTVENENRPVNAGRKISAYNEPISGIQANVGVVYTFGKKS
jgi:hypothetical protein